MTNSKTTPLYRNGYIKIVTAFFIMGLAFTMDNAAFIAVQFALGAIYFCMGLKLVLDARGHAN